MEFGDPIPASASRYRACNLEGPADEYGSSAFSDEEQTHPV
jgi:hypothetical protein